MYSDKDPGFFGFNCGQSRQVWNEYFRKPEKLTSNSDGRLVQKSMVKFVRLGVIQFQGGSAMTESAVQFCQPPKPFHQISTNVLVKTRYELAHLFASVLTIFAALIWPNVSLSANANHTILHLIADAWSRPQEASLSTTTSKNLLQHPSAVTAVLLSQACVLLRQFLASSLPKLMVFTRRSLLSAHGNTQLSRNVRRRCSVLMVARGAVAV
jgi:hypothetical protein